MGITNSKQEKKNTSISYSEKKTLDKIQRPTLKTIQPETIRPLINETYNSLTF